MKRLLPLVVLLSACAAPPTLYGQGVPVAPRAPAFNPATDAPITVGQPGHLPGVRVAPQPQPKPARHLPQTPATRKQAGIWASQAPDPEPLGVLLGLTLPYPPDAATEAEHEPTNLCAAVMGSEVKKAVGEAELRKLRPSVVACVSARLYAYCVDLLMENDFAMIRTLVAYDREWTKALRAAFGPAVMFADSMCSKLPPSDKAVVEDLVRRTNNQFITTIKEWK